MLDAAKAQGLQARGYGDMDVYWTLEEIISAMQPRFGRVEVPSFCRLECSCAMIVLGWHRNWAGGSSKRVRMTNELRLKSE